MLRKLAFTMILVFIALSASACSQHRDVATELSENEAQRICVLLQRNGLSSNKVKVGAEDAVTWSVQVETPMIVGDEAIASALYILHENDLPRDKKDPYQDIFKGNSGLIPTQTEEQLKKLSATQESIELTLERITGVVSAQVHVVLPNTNPLVDPSKQTQATASVLLKYNTKDLPLTVDEVRNLVAPSVEGLDANKVQVVMKAVPEPDITKFDNMKNRFIKIIGLSGVSLVAILVITLVYCYARIRRLGEKVSQLERSASRTPAKKDAAAPVPAAAR